MSAMLDQSRKVVPAQLGFLAIYNPSLGTSDETIEDQIVYYSASENTQTSKQKSREQKAARREEQNEQLRQIGLAQGMVEFGRSFSAGQAVDTVETEKSRIVLHELEAGWWILASINLTVLPVTAKPTPVVKGTSAEQVDTLEYSSREVKPAVLLLGDLLRAHSTFLLHHASSMSALFVRIRRSKFVSLLGRYWDAFIASWNVLMHGNPATELYGGIKIAACGELGVGVGEEDRGSGEREVLEGFVGRVNGLIDVVVSKFGDVDPSQSTPKAERSQNFQAKLTSPWLGSGSEPDAEDGAIFLGTGALSRKSLRDISHWVEDIYRYGSHAYGVQDNPSSTRRPKRSKARQTAGPVLPMATACKHPSHQAPTGDSSEPRSPDSKHSVAVIPPRSTADSDGSGRSRKSRNLGDRRPSLHRGHGSFASTDSESKKTNRYVHFLKFGYGTHWNLGGTSVKKGDAVDSLTSNAGIQAAPAATVTENDVPQAENSTNLIDTHSSNDNSMPHYLIGLLGDIEDEKDELNEHGLEHEDDEAANDENPRLSLRTLTLELEREEDARAEADISIDLGSGDTDHMSMRTKSEHTNTTVSSYDSQDRNKTKKLRVVVYANRPFIFVFLFELRTDALALGSLYRSMHYQLAPLIKPLLTSTTFRAVKPEFNTTEDSTTPIYDLVWDPKARTVNSTIPNIPDPGYFADDGEPSAWSRMDALNTHMQIINTYIAGTMDNSDLERTCKTSRGWWVVWTSIPQEEPTPTVSLASGSVKIPGLIHEESGESEENRVTGLSSRKRYQAASTNASTMVSSMFSGPAHPFLDSPGNGIGVPKHKEIFLVRRASDHQASRSKLLSASSFTGTESSWSSTPSKLAQGIGIDTKRYIDGLLNINR